MTTTSTSLAPSSAESPSLEICDSTDSSFSRQESTDSSNDETLELKDCISADQAPEVCDSQEEDDDDPAPMIPRPEASSLVRLISSCSVGSTESPHCPICLDPMTPIDHQHPLQCPTPQCNFNFCASCINSLLSSSKDDFEMASDGNMHVKIYLHCPNCRADHSQTIRDVLLLRKVDTVNWLMAQRNGKGAKLNPSQQRTKQAMKELHVQEAIQQARDKEIIFWKTHHQICIGEDPQEDDGEHKEDHSASRRSLAGSRYASSRRLREGSFRYEEWGVEADIDIGVHSSFRMPGNDPLLKASGHKKSEKKDTSKASPIDETLLQGLEGLMLRAEQLNVTHWMTSGNPDELAQAAQLLRRIEQDARQGIKPADRQRVMNRRASVYEIVAETRQLMEETPAKPQSAPHLIGDYNRRLTPRQQIALQKQQRAQEHLQLEMALAARASLLERCPLPVRMPKAVTLDLGSDPTSRSFPLRFCHDNWDGTVLDAYTKLTVAPTSRRRLASGASPQPFTVSKKPQGQHPGVFNVLSEGQYQRHYGHVQLTTEQPPRVLIASVQGAAGRQGVMKGDVVTHVDGQSISGKTVDELVALLRSKREGGNPSSIEMVLNSEASIAEALRRRAKVMDD